jgi:hypothetical protein
VAIHRRKGRGKKDSADDDEDDRERAAEPEASAVKFAEQKENAERGDYRGAHKAANGAAPAGATDLIAHSRILLQTKQADRRDGWPLQLRAARALTKHQNSRANQKERPQAAQRNVQIVKNPKIAEKEKHPDTYQKNGTEGQALA